MSRIQFKRTFASRHRKFCHPEFTCAARCNPDPRHDCSVANFDAGSAVTYEHKSTVFLQASLQREAPAEHAVLQLVKRKAKPNNPQAVLDVIDKFAWNSQWLMNIGDHKGAILDAAIQQHQPEVAIEFGTYIGYSAIRIAQQLPSGGKLYSMDPDETHMQLARQIIDHAGVSHKVEVIQGTLQTSTEVLRSKGVQKVDFVFLDHVEHLYKQDLQYLMSSGFLTEGAVVVADNVLYPGAPDYRAYVANSKAFASQEHLTLVQYSKTMQDIVTVSEYLGPENA